jgi:exopolysaccharide biosynthesis polyprenyl glycosylphosphotransferase
MNRPADSRLLPKAEAVFGFGIAEIDRGTEAYPRRQREGFESLTRFMPALNLDRSKKDCLAIVAPPERVLKRDHHELRNALGRVEIFSDRVASDENNEEHASVSDLSRLNMLVRDGRISRILVATPASESQRIAAVMRQLEGMNVDIDFVLEGFSTYSRLKLGLTDEVCIVRILKRPLSPSQALIKSIVDKVGALFLLVLMAPVLLFIALIVKLTSVGPILFRQQRFGLNNEVIEVLKFRTLYHHDTDPNAQQPVKKRDGRITPVGKYLRALSLDELPQLLNVLKGDMSLVGPRPLPVGLKIEGKACSDFPHYRARHRVLPGITGLAQVKGWRGGMQVAEDLKNRLFFDLAYVENYSLLLDAKILFATTLALLRPKNAY